MLLIQLYLIFTVFLLKILWSLFVFDICRLRWIILYYFAIPYYFVNIKEKEISSFMVFDIESFYPSITERLFTNAIQIAKQITKISDYDMSLINQSRKRWYWRFWCPNGMLWGSESVWTSWNFHYIEMLGWQLLKVYLVQKLRDWGKMS